MKDPVRVAITGAAGQISYALLFRVASGKLVLRFHRAKECDCLLAEANRAPFDRLATLLARSLDADSLPGR